MSHSGRTSASTARCSDNGPSLMPDQRPGRPLSGSGSAASAPSWTSRACTIAWRALSAMPAVEASRETMIHPLATARCSNSVSITVLPEPRGPISRLVNSRDRGPDAKAVPRDLSRRSLPTRWSGVCPKSGENGLGSAVPSPAASIMPSCP